MESTLLLFLPLFSFTSPRVTRVENHFAMLPEPSFGSKGPRLDSAPTVQPSKQRHVKACTLLSGSAFGASPHQTAASAPERRCESGTTDQGVSGLRGLGPKHCTESHPLLKSSAEVCNRNSHCPDSSSTLHPLLLSTENSPSATEPLRRGSRTIRYLEERMCRKQQGQRAKPPSNQKCQVPALAS